MKGDNHLHYCEHHCRATRRAPMLHGSARLEDPESAGRSTSTFSDGYDALILFLHRNDECEYKSKTSTDRQSEEISMKTSEEGVCTHQFLQYSRNRRERPHARSLKSLEPRASSLVQLNCHAKLNLAFVRDDSLRLPYPLPFPVYLPLPCLSS